MVASTIKGEGVGVDEIMQILDETSQVLEYSRQLEQKSKALEKATTELKAANERLTELDRLKDDFLSTVTHELRTPLTSIRSFSEILHDSPDLDLAERQHFLTIIIRESERLTRLINQVLDLTKIETGRMKWQMTQVDLGEVINHSVTSLRGLFEERDIAIDVHLPNDVPTIRADRDQLIQLVINLLSNAQKFCPAGTGRVAVDLTADERHGASSASPTTVPASRATSRRRSSRSSTRSAPAAPATRWAPASGSPSAAASSSTWAAGSGWKATPATAPPSSSPCR